MTLYTSLDDLSDYAIDHDLQSITGVRLRGFTTNFSGLLSAIRGFAANDKSADKHIWRKVLAVIGAGSAGVSQSFTSLAPLDELDANNFKPVPNAKAAEAVDLTPIAQRLSLDPRNYNYLNKLLGFGTKKDEKLSTVLEGASTQFGLTKADLQRPEFIDNYCKLVKIARGDRAVETIDQTGKPTNIVANMHNATFPESDSKLYLKLDLSEWLFINDPDILHVVVEPPSSLNGYHPLGRTTVWLEANAQVQHTRSKTSKTFLRGQIAERLRIEDIESNIAGFVNTIFDTDSEQAYSSTRGPC